jgi:hypothetical protein
MLEWLFDLTDNEVLLGFSLAWTLMCLIFMILGDSERKEW